MSVKYASPESMQANINLTKDQLKKKLTVVNSIPSFAVEDQTILYIGATTQEYVQGGIYKYKASTNEWELISTADVDLDDYETSWTGTMAEWEALSGEEQAKYVIVNITDDYVDGTSDHVIKGYYYNGQFYEEASHTTLLTPAVGYIYIDLPTDSLYLYNGTDAEYVLAGGGGTNSIVWGYYYNGSFYEEAAHTTVITPSEGYLYVDLDGDSIYLYKSNAYVQISGSSYTAGFGVAIDNDEIKTTDFVGTQAEWDALSSTQKAAYDFIHITDDTNAVSEGAPGHVIKDENGEKTQRTNLKFEGFTVTDDSTNDITKVATIPYTAGNKMDITNHVISADETVMGTFIGTKDEWDALPTADKAKYDIVNFTDDATAPSVVVDTVASGNMNSVTSNAVYKNIKSRSWVQELDVTTAYYETIKDADGVNALLFGKYMITLLTLTNVDDCASQYIVRNGGTSIVHEGAHQNAPRLTIDSTNTCYKVNLNGQTTLYGVYVKVDSLEDY